MLKTINLNATVRVKLSIYGKKIYFNKYRKDIFEKFIITMKEEDENGYSEWQLWELMEEFGSYMGIGDRLCFDKNIILIDEKEIEDNKC